MESRLMFSTSIAEFGVLLLAGLEGRFENYFLASASNAKTSLLRRALGMQTTFCSPYPPTRLFLDNQCCRTRLRIALSVCIWAFSPVKTSRYARNTCCWSALLVFMPAMGAHSVRVGSSDRESSAWGITMTMLEGALVNGKNKRLSETACEAESHGRQELHLHFSFLLIHNTNS